MRIQHRPIPALPMRPRVHPTNVRISRSYSGGRQNFARACQGEALDLTITTQDPLPDGVQVRLMTTLGSAALNSAGSSAWTAVPFLRTDAWTLTCSVLPDLPGLHSFRAEFSLDAGSLWLRDTIPDAWVLVDPPQVDSLRLYTLMPTVSGTVADWKADLTRIQEMGFNAVHLQPITALDTSESPYAASDLFALDFSYLKKDSPQDGLSQLAEYVKEAKSLGIRLCFDLVLNHIGVHSAMARQAADWIVPDQSQPDGLQRARYWFNQGWRTWDDLVLINYAHPSEAVRAEIWAYMTDYALFWASYADRTGGFMRFDNLHSSDPDFVQAVTAALRSEYPQVALLAEYFTDDRTLLNAGLEWGLNLLLATPWSHKFVPDLRDYLCYIHRVSGHVRYFMPITSQDSGSPAQEFGTADSTIPRYVAAALLGTGATGIPQGVEFGERERIDFIGRKPKMPLPAAARFGPFLRRVNAILAEYAAFRHGENCVFVDGGHPAVIAAFRSDTGAQALGFLVVCNFDTGRLQRISVDLASVLGSAGPFPCCELLSGEVLTFPQARFELQLAPCAAQVLLFSRISKFAHR